MSAFTAARDWYVPSRGRYVTTAPLTWEVGKVGSGFVVTVPRGFVFDLSVPWWGQWYANPHDPRHLGGAAVHDWLLHDGWPRWRAAGEFADALMASGVGRFKATVLAFATIVGRWSEV